MDTQKFRREVKVGELVTIDLKLPTDSYSRRHIDDIFGMVCGEDEEKVRIISSHQIPELRSVPYIKDGKRVPGMRIFSVPYYMIFGYEILNHSRKVR